MLQVLEPDAGLQVCATHCPYCALQCGMHLRSGLGNSWTVEERLFPTNNGGLCAKGWSAAELLGRSDRLVSPLVRDRRGEPFRAVGWPEALERIVSGIERLQAAHGRDSIGVFGGGSLTNEKAYLLGKFARVALRTSQIDYNGRFCMSSAAAASIKALGIDRGLPFPLADLPGAQTILLVGSNAAETMPPVMQYFQAQRELGGSLIVADPRRTPTAAAATLHLQITPGTDGALANGLLNIALKERYVDESFIASRTEGFEAVRKAAASYWPERVERITGISEKQLALAARLLGEAATAMILTARGPEQQSRGVANVLSFINLALALGKAGKPHCGYGCLTGQGNGQGGREHGQKADQLPGYRRLDNPAHRKHIAAIWGVKEEDLPAPGRSAYELLEGMGTDGGVRGMLVFGSNPVVSAPSAGLIQSRFDALDFLVVSDFFLSETCERADVVLPSAQWAEEEGTMTNLEGRVLLRQRAASPPEGVRTDAEILAALAGRLGYYGAFPTRAAEIFDELRAASAGGVADYSGITYERIAREDGVFWPCPNVAHPGTPRMFLDRFGTESGRARFHAVEFVGPAEEPDEEYPLYLTTGRVMAQYQSGTQTRRTPSLMEAAPRAFVEIHPAMAGTFGIADGDAVRLTTRRGSALMEARLTQDIRMDTVFAPFHFPGEGRVNLLTNPALDPTSKMPEFKCCAVRIEKGNLC